MEYTVEVYSKAFLDIPDPNGWANATLSRDLWEELYNAHTNHRLFLRFQNQETPVMIAVGNPHVDHYSPAGLHKIYLSPQFLERIGCYGSGEQKEVTVFTEEALPPVEQIKVRFIDSAVYNADVKSEMEQALGKLAVIQKNVQYQIPIEALGNYPVDVFIGDLQPADIVFCHGDDVTIEFEEPVDQITPPPPVVERPPTPIPPGIPDLMIPLPEESRGHILGSNPDIAPPLWRQQIGPPRRRQ